MLTEEQRARIERNREAARARLQARLQGTPLAASASVAAAEPVAPSVEETPVEEAAAQPEAEKRGARAALSLLAAELAAARRSSPDEAVQCYARLEEAMQEDGAAEAFKAAISERLDGIIVSFFTIFLRIPARCHGLDVGRCIHARRCCRLAH